MSTTSIAPVRGRPGRRKGSGKRAGAESEWGLRAVQALADPSRWRIVRELSNGASTLGDLAARVDLSPACTSHHVTILREAELVTTTRDARSTRCALTTEPGSSRRLLDLVLGESPKLSNRPFVRPKDIEDFLF